MMNLRGTGAIAMALMLAVGGWSCGAIAADPTPVANNAEAQINAFEQGLHKQTGDVVIGPAKATLHLGDRYYFLPAEDAKKVLTQIWGNPADAVSDVLGLVLPTGTTASDNVWGAVVTYEDTGFVSDKDAHAQDYDKVLSDMREGAAERNEERRKQGFSTVQIVGWAQPPSYNAQDHSLVWARQLKFGDSKGPDSLNYDVRLLGRRGVLSLNMVSDMAHLDEVRAAAAQFGRAASFDRGEAYADYDASTDKTAEYGLAGLVAAGAGVAAAKKLGLLAIVLGFGKKFIALIVVAGLAVVRWGKRLLGRKEEQPVESLEEAPLEKPAGDQPPAV
ncbi:DUF2167 domain-containing protein [Sphingomonas sp. CFBP8993]|uniref:DUF2167 domain-containing protein n=1 Tax=Sphingomonas sp. CFBP8993 TaxID=3096526 RepID=UPI002A6AED72|nr:DUF2167 domain-containing protein [Sphingomonas sp. CFBP8993]